MKDNKKYLNDDEISKIVFSDIEDDLSSSYYGIVFGNSMLINERVNTAYKAYKSGRIKKIVFTGGVNGVSNQNDNLESEAYRMSYKAIKLGVNPKDIIIDGKLIHLKILIIV